MVAVMRRLQQDSLPLSDGVRLKRRSASGSSATLTITEAAELLGNLAYKTATRDGELAGVPVIRVGRRLLIPQARLLTVLGLKDGTKPVGP